MKTEGYEFLTAQRSSITPLALIANVGVRDNEVNVKVPNVDVLVDDVIHLTYTVNNIPKGVYGVCIYVDMGAVVPEFTFKIDQNIYELYSNIPQGNVTSISNYRGTVYDKVSQYDIKTNVTRATYSEELRSYNTSLDYELVINQELRSFFGGFKTVIIADKILFADYCNSYAYGVSLSEDSYNNINNVFKQSVNFNIAKR